MSLKTDFLGAVLPAVIDGYDIIWFPDAQEDASLAANLPVADVNGRPKTLVVYKVNGPRPSDALFRSGVLGMISVSGRSATADEYAGDVRECLREWDRHDKLMRNTVPPAVDPVAAAKVAAAMRAMPPSTPQDRKNFLDDFYGGTDGPC